MNPGVAQLLCDYGQLVLVLQHNFRKLVHGAGDNLRAGVFFPQALHFGGNAFRRGGAAVVGGVGKFHGVLSAHAGSAVQGGIVQNDLVLSVAQAAQRGELHHFGGAVDADVQIPDASLGQVGDHSMGVAGHVRHFSGNGVPAKLLVQLLGDA